MLRKSLYSILFVLLAVGAFYSYQKVDFSRKTAMFFHVVFGSENAMGRGPGYPPMSENKGGESDRSGRLDGQGPGAIFQGGRSGHPPMGEGVERGAPPHFGREGGRGFGPHKGGRGGRGTGSVISLGNVALYAVIMAFVVMIVRLLDWFVFRSRRTAKS